jgi:hypothetical protein
MAMLYVVSPAVEAFDTTGIGTLKIIEAYGLLLKNDELAKWPPIHSFTCVSHFSSWSA